ncbi:MAG: alcohol dehydrogenase catalytic domain-containing protein [Gammaproteobacteria bacterium]|nr:alcohol dehydrogenase catalytic domain-containing protein [Gammaproteobacteria bacterium]
MAGYADFSGVPGHEFVGRVVEGPASWQGRRVAAEINASCGHCRMCGLGHPKHCESRTVVGIRNRSGAFAEFVAVPATNCHLVARRTGGRGGRSGGTTCRRARDSG